jgi:hypothetical protein
VYERHPPAGIGIEASSALIEAGLRRAIATSGLDITENRDQVAIRIHADDVEIGQGIPVDVEVAANHTTITVFRAVDSGTWLALHAIVQTLLEPEEPT